jgi:hypothetical protein
MRKIVAMRACSMTLGHFNTDDVAMASHLAITS